MCIYSASCGNNGILKLGLCLGKSEMSFGNTEHEQEPQIFYISNPTSFGVEHEPKKWVSSPQFAQLSSGAWRERFREEL